MPWFFCKTNLIKYNKRYLICLTSILHLILCSNEQLPNTFWFASDRTLEWEVFNRNEFFHPFPFQEISIFKIVTNYSWCQRFWASRISNQNHRYFHVHADKNTKQILFQRSVQRYIGIFYPESTTKIIFLKLLKSHEIFFFQNKNFVNHV